MVAPGGRGNAFWSVGVEMARTEGIRSLAGGMSASMLREVVYSGIRMGTYELFKDKSVFPPHQLPPTTKRTLTDFRSLGYTTRRRVRCLGRACH